MLEGVLMDPDRHDRRLRLPVAGLSAGGLCACVAKRSSKMRRFEAWVVQGVKRMSWPPILEIDRTWKHDGFVATQHTSIRPHSHFMLSDF
jgi:hypothetical protein